MFRHIGEHRDYWKDKWAKQDLRKLIERYGTGRLDEFEDPFLRYLPRDLPVLEAGCGPSQLVAALHARGYDVEGIDYEPVILTRVQEVAPHLKVRVGDVFHIDVPDKSYGGYVSIGVFEHQTEGPGAGLTETCRVLHPRGYAFITVPYLNRARSANLQNVRKADSDMVSEHGFYQYYFSVQEFTKHVQSAGMRVVETIPYALYSGLTRDYGIGSWLDEKRFFSWRIHRLAGRICRSAPMWAKNAGCHMMMFVCQRAQ